MSSSISQLPLGQEPINHRDATANVSPNAAAGGANPSRSLTWQRAFEEARHTDFGRWFGPAQSLRAATSSRLGAGFAGISAEHAESVIGSGVATAPAVRIAHEPDSGGRSTALDSRAADRRALSVPTPYSPAQTLLPAGAAQPAPSDVGVRDRVERIAAALTREFSLSVTPVWSSDEAFASSAPVPTPSPVSPFGALFDSTGLATVAMNGDRPPSDSVTQDIQDTSRTTSQGRANEKQEPVRIYAEWSARGVSIWLGSDASMLPGLQAMASQLRQWIEARGERLVALVCNGRSWPGNVASQADGATPARDDSSSPWAIGNPSRREPASTDLCRAIVNGRALHDLYSIDPYSPETP